jgi:hypothetical protein
MEAERILTGIYWLLVINKERLAFTSANNCQGQLQTSQLGSVVSLLRGQIT